MFQIFAQLFQAAPEQTYLPRLLCFLPFARRSRIWNSLLNDAVPWPSVGPKARRPNGRRDTAPARFASHAGLASLNRLESVRAAWPNRPTFPGMILRARRLAFAAESASPYPQVCLPVSYAAMPRTLDRSDLEIEAEPQWPVAMPTVRGPTHRFCFAAHP